MSHVIAASKGKDGVPYVTVAINTPVGYQNVVAEIDLGRTELTAFMQDLAAAMERADGFEPGFYEKVPGPYEVRGWNW